MSGHPKRGLAPRQIVDTLAMTSSITQPAETAAPLVLEAATERNIRHLYGDIAGFGVLSGTAVSFLAIYATRLGAANFQIGLLTAGPALVNLLITLPAGQWVAARKLAPVVFWTSVGQRLIYPLLVFVALLLAPAAQVQAILAMVVLASIPGTALAIAFNALFAEAVPESRRGDVVGKRNALLALTMLVSLLISGQILRLMPPEQSYAGYAIVFAIGTLGAAYSSYHLFRIRLASPMVHRSYKGTPMGDAERSGRVVLSPDAPLVRLFASRMLTRLPTKHGMRVMLRPLRTPFGPFVFSLFAFHFAQYVPIALFTLFWVRVAKLNDAQISYVNATFYTVMLVASLRLGRLTARYGNRRLVIAGAFLLASYPLFTALSWNITLLLVAAIVGGAVWAVLGGALSNRLLERVPADDRPTHLALYNMALNAAMLIGAMVGTTIASAIGLREALFVAVVLRIGAAALLWRLG